VTNALQEIVNAVLYEGYILYPYRASALKNQRERFTFGRIYPQVYSRQQQGRELCQIGAEVLLETDDDAADLEITLGFLQPIQREIGTLPKPLHALPPNEDLPVGVVPKLELNGKLYQTWMEAAERRVTVHFKNWQETIEAPFKFDAQCLIDPTTDDDGSVAAVIRRLHAEISGKLTVKAARLRTGLFKISVTVSNQSSVDDASLETPEKILMHTLASTHLIFQAAHGNFVSLLETPDELKELAGQCQNVGVWPVLVGDQAQGERQTMLASPIILYDYPRISPDSAGNFFDGTEIDEMLTLRVMTMTDGEKTEMQLDDFSRRILERTQAVDGEDILKLHGGMRPVHLSNEEFFNPTHSVKSVRTGGVELSAGDKVLIRPTRRADAIDLILAGKTAVIEALEQDAEGQVHLALVLDDDPGGDLGMARQSGHRFFYRADEVEPCKVEVPS
jgi:hydrogenase maturation protease